MSEYREKAEHALEEAQTAIEEVGSLKQDEFQFYHHLVKALVYALLEIADSNGAID